MRHPVSTSRVQRFDYAERAVHWLVALSFLYSALSGLALWSRHLFWIAAVLGGGVTVRWAHPWVGVLFVALFGAMSFRWAGQMRLDGDDRRWLRQSHRYARHETARLPEAGRFNGGQKMLFWLQAVAGLLLLASGLLLWFPGQVGRSLHYAALLVHPVAAVAAIGGIIVHIYMATAVVRGSMTAMVRGWVSPGWAASHHPKWYRKTSGR